MVSFLGCDFLLECVYVVCVRVYIELFGWRENESVYLLHFLVC